MLHPGGRPHNNLDLDLDLLLALVHVDTLGHTPMPFVFVKAHCICIFQVSPVLVDFFLDCLLSLLLADLVLFGILEPPVTVLVGPSVSHDQASAVFFL